MSLAVENSPLLTKSSSPGPPSPTSLTPSEHRTYKIRWLVLFVFFSHILYTNLAWSNFDSIADLTVCYYNVDVFWVNSLVNLYFITYILFFIPATWFLGRFGLKWAAIVSGCIGSAGGWLRFAGTGPQYFWLVILGQTLASVPNIIEWSAPALLSAVWFPANERAIATTLVGAIAPQVGILISLVLGPVIFKNSETLVVCNDTADHGSFEYSEWQGDIYNRMFYYQLGQAIFATLVVPMAFGMLCGIQLIIPSAPPIPPSVSKHIEDGYKKMNIFESLLALLKNIHFLLFLVVFGLLLGVSAVYVTVYEEVLSRTGYKDYETTLSYLGLGIQVVAIIVLIAVGKWIDFTKLFYGTTLFVCLGSSIVATGLAVGVWFELQFYLICILCTVTVAMVVMFQGIGYEFGVEMTFPVQEGVSTSLLNAVSQVVATAMTFGATAMIKHYSKYVFFFLAGSIFLGFLVQIFVKPKLRRVELDSPNSVSLGETCCGLFHQLRPLKATTIQSEAIHDRDYN